MCIYDRLKIFYIYLLNIENVDGKNLFNKVYRTIQELGIQAFTEQSFGKFTEVFKIKYGTFRKND